METPYKTFQYKVLNNKSIEIAYFFSDVNPNSDHHTDSMRRNGNVCLYMIPGDKENGYTSYRYVHIVSSEYTQMPEDWIQTFIINHLKGQLIVSGEGII